MMAPDIMLPVLWHSHAVFGGNMNAGSGHHWAEAPVVKKL